MTENCRHDILNATLCIRGIKRKAIKEISMRDPHAIPTLLQINYFLNVIEGRVKNCKLAEKRGCQSSD